MIASANGHRVGRPSKFTPEMRAEILRGVEMGCPYSTAARAAGVSYKVFKEWMRKGLSADPARAEFRAFRAAVKMASAKAERDAVEVVHKAAQRGEWAAAMTFLERRNPRRWGRLNRAQVELMHRTEQPPLIDSELERLVISDPEASRHACDLTARVAALRALPPPAEGSAP